MVELPLGPPIPPNSGGNVFISFDCTVGFSPQCAGMGRPSGFSLSLSTGVGTVGEEISPAASFAAFFTASWPSRSVVLVAPKVGTDAEKSRGKGASTGLGSSGLSSTDTSSAVIVCNAISSISSSFGFIIMVIITIKPILKPIIIVISIGSII